MPRVFATHILSKELFLRSDSEFGTIQSKILSLFSFFHISFLDYLSNNYSQIAVPLEAMLMTINIPIISAISVTVTIVTQTENVQTQIS